MATSGCLDDVYTVALCGNVHVQRYAGDASDLQLAAHLPTLFWPIMTITSKWAEDVARTGRPQHVCQWRPHVNAVT
jgi:hypothetical protein